MKNEAKVLAIAVNHLNKLMETDFIYLIGSRTKVTTVESIFEKRRKRKSVYLHLFVITPNEFPMSEFLDSIENLKNLKIKLYVATSTPAALQEQLLGDDPNLYHLMSNATLIDAQLRNNPAAFDAFSTQLYNILCSERYQTADGVPDAELGADQIDNLS